jgi:5-methyltetrahydropteroyltriglutamate--homocysteine methyltransferase
MKTTWDRILTTHVGSLPRPADLAELLQADDRGDKIDQAGLKARVADAVNEMVKRQAEAGIDIVSDGEMSKVHFSTYVRRCLKGVGPGDAGILGSGKRHGDLLDHPDFADWVKDSQGKSRRGFMTPTCKDEVSYGDNAPLLTDLANLKSALGTAGAKAAFVPSASPGTVSRFVNNAHYKTDDAYLEALSEAMRVEYEAIAAAGFDVQLDCPDLASHRHSRHQDLTDAEFLKIAAHHIEAFNHSVRNIPRDQIRLHVCWGNYEGPHTRDIDFKKIAPVIFKARARAFLFEGANPRHHHEWEDFKKTDVPDDVILVPGVIDSCTNFVEHPKLVAQRICNWAGVVGKERVMAGTDCGFGTFAEARRRVAPSVVWSKFKSLAEGAALATKRLWP